MTAWDQWTDLQKVHPSARGVDWETDAVKVLPKLKYELIYKEAKEGPDGWPYLFVRPTPKEQAESFKHITSWLQSRGIGLVISSASVEEPDFVFSYGMVWNYLEAGQFHSEGGVTDGEISVKDGQTVWVGAPSEEYFPSYVRGIVKKFLVDQGVLRSKILMVSQDQKNFDLFFSTKSLCNP